MTSYRTGIYTGHVIHSRVRPVHHKLRYSVFSLLLDVDDIDQVDSRLRYFSHNRFNLFSVWDRDHGTTCCSSIRESLHKILRNTGFGDTNWNIEMLCYPRVLGYVFNPLTVYFCRDSDNSLKVLVYEVNNTFGNRSHYVVPVSDGLPEICDHGCSKTMTVSPFNHCRGTYRFKVHAPGDALMISITYRDKNAPVLRALFTGERKDMTDRALLKLFLSYPFFTLKVIASIHLEAVRIWLKGVPFVGRKAAALGR